MLTPTSDESRRLIDWVEGGVYDAIKKNYLKSLFFGVSTDREGTSLLEVRRTWLQLQSWHAFEIHGLTSDNFVVPSTSYPGTSVRPIWTVTTLINIQ